METFFPDHLLEILIISITFSTILMLFVQKLKQLSFLNKSWQIWILNLICSFLIGIPFTMTFYQMNFTDGIWVSLFSFIGASSIYYALKNQNIINYHPSSASQTITLSKTKEIKR
ncbi:MAG: hypothetical protein MR388_03410 [Tenericutes bacterium]|mgnify:FL=1|nr:hypothetical protein [Mycoplasmatota bacterium]